MVEKSSSFIALPMFVTPLRVSLLLGWKLRGISQRLSDGDGSRPILADCAEAASGHTARQASEHEVSNRYDFKHLFISLDKLFLQSKLLCGDAHPRCQSTAAALRDT